MSRGERWTGAGAVNAPHAMQPPHQVQDLEDRDRAADDQQDDERQDTAGENVQETRLRPAG